MSAASAGPEPLLECLDRSVVKERWVDRRSALFRIERSDRRFLTGMGGCGYSGPARRILQVPAVHDSQVSLRMVGPSRYGPPEKVYGAHELDEYGIYLAVIRGRRTAYLPWQPDRFYYSHALQEYRFLLGRSSKGRWRPSLS